jgi:hypothetical protein
MLFFITVIREELWSSEFKGFGFYKERLVAISDQMPRNIISDKIKRKRELSNINLISLLFLLGVNEKIG